MLLLQLLVDVDVLDLQLVIAEVPEARNVDLGLLELPVTRSEVRIAHCVLIYYSKVSADLKQVEFLSIFYK